MRLFILSRALLFVPGALPAWAAPPAAPSNVVLVAPYVSTLKLSWQDNSDNETGFEISYRAGTSATFSSLGTVAANRTTLDLNGANPLTTYQFRIRSYLNPGPEYSSYVGPATVTTPGFINPPALLAPLVAAPPPAPQSLIAGSSPVSLSLAGLFSDPDVTSAARLTTDLGNLDFAFYPNSAPLTVANFLAYLNRGDFANTIFHRSVPGFIIQAGAFRADATASAVPTTPAVLNEPSITNARGTIAMAKLGGNPDSATNQFFINLADNAANLNNQNGGFTVFARIAGNGMTVADAIAGLPLLDYRTLNGALTDTPVRGTPPPPAYDPSTLVRINNAAVIAPLVLNAASSAPGIATAAITGTDLAPTVALTPLNSGTATITLTATDLDNQPVSTTFSVTVQDAYDLWAAQQSFAQPADGFPTADPDQDSSSNLIEFAFPSPPLAASPNSVVPGLAANHLTLTFPLRSNLAGTTVTLQSAASLNGPWTDRWSASNGFVHPWIAATEDLGTHRIVTARDPDPLDPARRFLRLKVTRP
jgi:cyclophilin family peptidyl-prolyl cis-trans isomerase